MIDFAENNPDQGSSVQALVEESKKVVESVHPEASLYEIRHFVDQTSLAVTQDPSARQVIQLKTAADRLGLAFELIQIGAYDLAQTSLEDYELGFNQVLMDLGGLDFEHRQEVILAILDQKIRDLQYLKLIVNELTLLQNGEAERSEPLRIQLDALHEDTLYQLNTLVLNSKERAVLHLGTFLEDVKGDKEIQLQILNRLKKNVPLDFQYIKLINDIESLYLDESGEVFRVEKELLLNDLPLNEYRGDHLESDVSGLKEVKLAE